MSTTELTILFPSERLDALRFFMDRKQRTVENELQDYLDKTYEKFVPQNVREYVESRTEQDQEQTAESQQASAAGEGQTPVPRECQPRPSRRQREQAAPETPAALEAQAGAEEPAEEETQGMTMSM